MPLARATLYTDAHRIEGQILLRERLAEALNDQLTDYLELVDVLISSAVDPTVGQVEWPHAVIPKSSLLFACLDSQEHESAASRVDKLVAKSGRQVGAIVGDVTIYGTGHVTEMSAPSTVLRTQLQAFFPVTLATVHFSNSDRSDFETKLALVNRQELRAFTMV